VVTGLIKSNLPCRIAFRVASRMDSRIVLDQNGAEVLMGQGDMLFLPPGSAKLIRSQGCYMDDAEVRQVVEYLKGKVPQEFHQELINLRKKSDENEDGEGGDTGPRDPLFDQAARIVIEAQRGSVSLLQRKLTIGYGRAARLIDQMAEVGIVGGYKGSQAREVVMSLEEWDAYCTERPAIEADLEHDKELFEDEPAN
jgi:S-DNA-T family DNA segregation ATPase FtsK/SpoIIIE